jgi:Molybdopterin biosynthesis enzyme
MIPVAEARAGIRALCTAVGSEIVPLSEAAGRVLAAPVTAPVDQPPFPSSAMDGYAVASASAGETLRLLGTSKRANGSRDRSGRARRCASLPARRCPKGATRIVIQEGYRRRRATG